MVENTVIAWQSVINYDCHHTSFTLCCW